MDTDKSIVTVKKDVPEGQELVDYFRKELGKVSLTYETREKFLDLFYSALALTPKENIEDTPVKEDNVVCKLFLKGYPHVLGGTVDGILKSLVVKNKNGYTDYEKTNEYVMTLMIEKSKKG